MSLRKAKIRIELQRFERVMKASSLLRKEKNTTGGVG